MLETAGFKKKYKHFHQRNLSKALKAGTMRLYLKGLSGSSSSVFASQIFEQEKVSQFFILPDNESAAYFYNDLLIFLEPERIFFFPSSYKRSVKYQQPDPGNLILRTEVLNQLSSSSKKIIIVTYPEALAEKVLSRKDLKDNTLQLKTGELLSISFIQEVLDTYGFEQVDFVYEPGKYSIRGSLVDIFSFSNDYPYRIDFFGDEVESIRTFDIETQLSIETCEKIFILPDINKISAQKKAGSVLSLLPTSCQIWSDYLENTATIIDNLYNETTLKGDEEGKTTHVSPPDNDAWLISGRQFIEDLQTFSIIEFGLTPFFSDATTFTFQTIPQPVFNKNFNLLEEDLVDKTNLGYSNFLFTENEKQIERLKSVFSDRNSEVNFKPVLAALHEGFIDHDLKICCYTDHQIFERYHKFKLNKGFSKKEAVSIRELTGLHPGDYVVHIDQGIGRFGGLEKIEVNGKIQEAIKLVYRDNDILYVNIHSLHRISKYKGKDTEPPKIYKLGSPAWQNLKNKTKRKVKDIARELIQLYAKRKEQSGFQFSPDTYLQQELEASFFYEDTPDQLEATKAVKESMESANPMDLLVCGDVGFGKTEIAMRAAFKAVADSKQVAILVPTTILALQHFNTFRKRLEAFPCSIDYLSRFRTPKDQRTIIQNLKEGKLDIIIGTHKLVGKDIHFKDLGLFIIDEEQKFGVTVKEKIRQLKVNVDTLTLTATPIPRTLQFSMMGARDLSIIRTPPPNRHPILTELHGFNETIIREGIEYEMNRGGQVFFIHNRVENIEKVKLMIERLLPKAKCVIAHGKMEGRKLEAIMLDFISGDYDVLIATTIIESGLDIPNVNTIFINHAQNFGLSDLHQLRGRVGRSNKKAFCFLLIPPINLITQEASRRLKAIEAFSELGSGFNIALQDLDIRGAGNLLGGEQSGFIAEIGFEAYHRILQEALNELNEKEFSHARAEEKESEQGKDEIRQYVREVHIDTDLEVLFPDEYIDNISERIRLYRLLDNIQSEEELVTFKKNLEDRFGPVPHETIELLHVVTLRRAAARLGFEKIILKRRTLVFHLVNKPESSYYSSKIFRNLLSALQKDPQRFRLKEVINKLVLTTSEVPSIVAALEITNWLIKKVYEEG